MCQTLQFLEWKSKQLQRNTMLQIMAVRPPKTRKRLETSSKLWPADRLKKAGVATLKQRASEGRKVPTLQRHATEGRTRPSACGCLCLTSLPEPTEASSKLQPSRTPNVRFATGKHHATEGQTRPSACGCLCVMSLSETTRKQAPNCSLQASQTCP